MRVCDRCKKPISVVDKDIPKELAYKIKEYLSNNKR